MTDKNSEPPPLNPLMPPPPNYPYSPSSAQLIMHFPQRFSRMNQGYSPLAEEDLVPLEPRASILLPHLQLSEKQFFEIVQSGDVAKMRQFLADQSSFNINCVNFQGVSALHVAVQSGSSAMVEALLEVEGIEIGDCILHAVRDNVPHILKLLLDKQHETAPGLEYVGVTHSSDFPDHVTPLILAAQCGHYEIIEMLIERGHRIVKPHSPDCLCGECRLRLEREDLLYSETLRLNLYRAVTNPAYICHSTHDPILAAFKLSDELRRAALIVTEFRAAYSQLAEDISRFAVELIGCCRTTEEMELILCQTNGISGTNFIFPRLILAMDCKQKEFVAHPNTQQIVEATWRGHWYEWTYSSTVYKFFYPFYRLLMLPLMAIMCIFMPHHKMVKHWQIPVNKLITHTICYFAFLAVIFLESNRDKRHQKRGPPHTGLETVIVLFVFAYIWGCFRLCAIQGPKRYFRILWSWHDMIMNVLFLITFLFWLCALIDINNNDQIDLERKYWHHLDPALISEGTFAIATIMAYFRLLYLCRLSYYLGPLQISLGKMSADFAKYITIFAIIIFAFSAGLCRFYQYYYGMVQTDDASGIKTAQVSSFVDFQSTVKTFFWALFCMSDLESANVIIENLPGESENNTIINRHTFTENVGYICFALFETLTVIVILNMLIATMASTFQRVIDNVAVEWTFGKTEFYIEYMAQTTLPPPLNLLPTGSGILSMIEWLKVFTQNPRGKKAYCSLGHCCYVENQMDERLVKDFPILMTKLVQRYFREKDAAADTTLSDMDFIKEELSSIRVLLEKH